MNSIFVSSTFRDMQFERDALRDISVPIINETAAKYGERVSFCDLRWGINTEEMDNEISERKVLSVCLDEIDRCNPPMIVILGDRYGYVPTSNLVSDVAKRKKLQLDDYKKSVTALEIEYGSLQTKPKLSNTLFYFREIEGILPEGYTDTDDEHTKKLKELKNRIIALTDGKLKTYKLSFSNGKLLGIKDFAKLLAKDVVEFLEPEWEKRYQLSPIEKERIVHWNYAKEKSDMFRARTSLCKQYIKRILDGQQLLVFQGDTGCGKSTLISKLVMELKHLGKNVIPVFCGLTTKSSTSISILRDIVYELEDVTGEEHLHKRLEREDKIEFEDIKLSDWKQQFIKCCDLLSEKGTEYFFIIDAVDQLSKDDSLTDFIPYDITKGMHFIFSCVTNFDTEKVNTEILNPPNKTETEEIIYGILDSHHRELSRSVVSAIIDKPNSLNPLYVNLLIERLFLMNANDYEAISNIGDGVTAISAHQLSIINQCPDDLNELCYDILVEGGNRINPLLVPEILKYISVTKYGITREALKTVLKEAWIELDFAYFVSYMNDFFILREDGRYDFSHKNIREAILSFSDKLVERHSLLYEYSIGSDDSTLDDELMYHAVNSSQAEYISRSVSHENATLVKNYIFDGLDPLIALDIAKYAVSNSNKKAIYFVVEHLLSRYIRENNYSMSMQIIKVCKSFFNEKNDTVNCLECLRFEIEEMYLYILNKEKRAATELKSTLEKLVLDVGKVRLKEEEIERENKRNEESLEKNKKWLAEQHKEGKNKWLIVPRGIVDFIGSFYSEERTINHFKNDLVRIASALLEAVDALVVGNYNKLNRIISELQFPDYPHFGLYKGWLLDSGESSQAFKLRMMTRDIRETDQILFVDLDGQ